MVQFNDNFIFCSWNDASIHEQFINIDRYYGEMLTNSIKILEQKGKLNLHKNKFYNYLLIDAKALYILLEKISDKKSPSIDDLAVFKNTIIYIGKGCENRKTAHFCDVFKMMTGEIKSTARLDKILRAWEMGEGVIVLEINSNSNNYISMCRETAMIWSVGESLTNLINGAAFGAMKTTWTYSEIKLFGDMLLFFALKMCINEKPKSILYSDFFEPKKYIFKSYYELKGILDCFLEM